MKRGLRRMKRSLAGFMFFLPFREKGKKNGTPGAIRTRDLLLRRQSLYPTELRVPMRQCLNIFQDRPVFKASRRLFSKIPPPPLEKFPLAAYIIKLFQMVVVAQLVRAPGCGPGGRGFESRLPPHFFLHTRRRASAEPLFFRPKTSFRSKNRPRLSLSLVCRTSRHPRASCLSSIALAKEDAWGVVAESAPHFRLAVAPPFAIARSAEAAASGIASPSPGLHPPCRCGERRARRPSAA